MANRKKTTAKKEHGIFDFLKLSESYSSLILGIVVVIIGTVLLLSLVRTRNTNQNRSTDSQFSVRTDDDAANSATESADTRSTLVITEVPTPSPTIKPTNSPVPTLAPTAKPTTKIVATKPVTPTVTPAPDKKSEIAKVSPTDALSKKENNSKIEQGTTYTIKSGDNLWSIAQATYKSGYNWVDIARANKLSNPDNIIQGQKLVLPKVEQKNATSEPEWRGIDDSTNNSTIHQDKITSDKYVVKKGDTLWSIAVRSYGDGYQFTKLKNSNSISNPDLILEGQDLKIPRK